MRVLLADDCAPVLNEVEALLTPEFQVIAKVQRGDAMVSVADELQPDIIIADITMPGGDGIEASRQLLGRHPGLPIVLLTTSTEAELVRYALSIGVRGFVHKVEAGEQLIAAVRAAVAGRVYVSPSCLDGQS
jgi:DNA-binding NarL/FixJ family response regulator